MSLKNKFFSVITLAFAIVGFTTVAAAQTTEQSTEGVQKQRKFERRGMGERKMGKGMKGGKHGGFGMRGLNRLNLTDAQKTQIQGIFEAQRTANQPFHQEMRDLIQKKRGGTITETEQARFDQLKTQMKASGEQTRNTILSILTVEQRQQLDQMKQEKQQRRQQFKERRQNRQRPNTSETIN